MKPIYQLIILVACLIRVLGQSLWPFIGGEQLYYVTQGMFELAAVFILMKHCDDPFKSMMQFFVGVCAYSLLKEVWQPTELDLNEYIGFAVGFVFVTIQIIYNARKKS